MDETDPEQLRRFKLKLNQRYKRILRVVESIPEGWRIRPKRRKRLLNVDCPWRDPDLVPKTFPPQLTSDHLSESLETHPLVQKKIITEDLAEHIASLHPHDDDVSCNFLLLRNGPVNEESLVQKWLSCRLFGEMDSTHVVESVRCNSDSTQYLHLSFQELDPGTLSEEQLNEILEASGLFLLVEDHTKMEESFHLLQKTISVFEDSDLMPPIVILDGRQIQHGLIHQDSVLPIHPRTESEIFECLRNYLDCSIMDVFVVPLSQHLGGLTRSIFKDLCDKWRSDLKPEFQPREELMVLEDTEMDQHDPIDHALQLIAPALLLRPKADLEEVESDDQVQIDVEKLARDWDKEWKRLKSLGEILNVESEEELFNVEHRRQMYIESSKLKSLDQPIRTHLGNQSRTRS